MASTPPLSSRAALALVHHYYLVVRTNLIENRAYMERDVVLALVGRNTDADCHLAKPADTNLFGNSGEMVGY